MGVLEEFSTDWVLKYEFFSPVLIIFYSAAVFPLYHFNAQLQNYFCCIIKGFLHIQEEGVRKFNCRGKRLHANMEVTSAVCWLTLSHIHYQLLVKSRRPSIQLWLQHWGGLGMQTSSNGWGPIKAPAHVMLMLGFTWSSIWKGDSKGHE